MITFLLLLERMQRKHNGAPSLSIEKGKYTTILCLLNIIAKMKVIQRLFQTDKFCKNSLLADQTIKYAKGNFSDRRKIISDENMDLYKRRKAPGNVNYVGEQ